jgi:rhodanese-related sulfurtransferase
MIRKAVRALWILGISCVLLAGCTQTGPDQITAPAPAEAAASPVKLYETQGYLSIDYDGTGFIAAGTGGRLDKISADKQVTPIAVTTKNDLLKVFHANGTTLVGGAGGIILYSTDSTNFSAIETGISSAIYDIAYFNGKYYASSDDGVILSAGIDGTASIAQQLETENDIISIAANSQMLMAITAESEILTSSDGFIWKVENFNDVYEGYYVPYTFTAIQSMGEAFFVTGYPTDEPGTPYVMVSDTGEVWMQKPLDIIEGLEPGEAVDIRINALAYDTDQLLAACDGGRILTISDCYKCNKIDDFAETSLKDIAIGDGKLVVVGDNYAFVILDSAAARQYSIQAEQALADMQSGGVIIDVRDEEDYLAGHISGSLNIPLDEIETKLPSAVPDKDTKIIFYCAVGLKSETAIEKALTLGYAKVYNLGAFADWPYTTE